MGNGTGGSTQDLALFAVNPDGTQKWKISLTSPVFTPAIGLDGTIYFQDFTSTLYAINSNGTEHWRYTLSVSYEVGQVSPAIGYDGTVFICADGVYAIRPDGSLQWHYNDPISPATYIRTSPAMCAVDSSIIIARTYPPSIWKLSPEGKRTWKFDVPGGAIFSSPAIATDGTIYVGAESSDKSFLYSIKLDSTLKWKYTITGGRPVRSSPAIGVDGTIYVGTKAGASLNAELLALHADGTLKWSFMIDRAACDIYCSPTIGADETIYFGAETGYLYAFDPMGMVKWSYNANDGINWTSPAITTDGTLYVGANNSNLFAVKTSSSGIANSPWPKFRNNNKNTGRRN